MAPEVAHYAIIAAVIVVLLILAFALIAHFRSSSGTSQPTSSRTRLKIDTGRSRIDWTQEDLHDLPEHVEASGNHGERPSPATADADLNNSPEDTPDIIGGAPPHAEPVPKLVTGMEHRSFRSFIGTLRTCRQAVFVNIELDLTEWFDPWTQVHLALQDCAFHHIQMSELLRLLARETANDPNVALTPFTRILVIPEEWPTLRDRIRARQYPESNLLPLVLIHSCMGCPLALVTADRFAEHILLEHRQFFTDPTNDSTIGLPSQKMEDMVAHTVNARNILQEALNQMAMERGILNPSIDCALLDLDDGNPPDVWKAVLDHAGIANYFHVTEKSIETLRDKEINVSACANAEIVSQRVRQTAAIMASAVFETVDTASLSITPPEGEFNPVLSALASKGRDLSSISMVRAKRQFDPFVLLHAAGAI